MRKTIAGGWETPRRYRTAPDDVRRKDFQEIPNDLCSALRNLRTLMDALFSPP